MKKILKDIGIIVGIFAVIFLGYLAFDSLDAKTVKFSDDFEVVNKFAHDTTSFTEGLYFKGDNICESSGLYKKSRYFCGELDGEQTAQIKLPDEVFGEGVVELNDKLYVLTYKENEVLVYRDNELVDRIGYGRSGWGLTTDGEYLIASDGSEHIYYMSDKLSHAKELTVLFNGKEVDNLNELEYVDGYIYANVWQTNYNYKIDANNGRAVRRYDFSELKDENIDGEVMNGIAVHDGHLFVTGKYWKYLYELAPRNGKL